MVHELSCAVFKTCHPFRNIWVTSVADCWLHMTTMHLAWHGAWMSYFSICCHCPLHGHWAHLPCPRCSSKPSLVPQNYADFESRGFSQFLACSINDACLGNLLPHSRNVCILRVTLSLQSPFETFYFLWLPLSCASEAHIWSAGPPPANIHNISIRN